MKDKKPDNAREKAIKSELLNFRMPADRIRLIYEIAEKNKVTISTLLRNWINERIDQEGRTESKPPTKEQIKVLTKALDDLSERLRKLESQAKAAPAKEKVSKSKTKASNNSQKKKRA